jgi:tight adherence protein C
MFDTVTYIPLALGVGTFLVILMVLTGLYQYLREQTRSRDLLNKLRGTPWEGELPDQGSAPAASLGVKQNRLLSLLGVLGQRVGPKEASVQHSRMRTRFLRAGLRRPSYPALFWGAKCLLAVLLTGAFISVRLTIFQLENMNMVIYGALVVAIAGFYLPDLWLAMRIARRKRRIFEGIPDTLDLLVVCVEAGMGLDAAMNRIAEEIQLSNPTMSEELKIYNLEVRAGKNRQEGLQNLAMRIDLDDFSSLITLLIQTDRFGTSMAQALRIYSDTFRTKRFILAEELAAKLPTKLMVPLILFIFPSLFAVILGPAAVRMYQMITSTSF